MSTPPETAPKTTSFGPASLHAVLFCPKEAAFQVSGAGGVGVDGIYLCKAWLNGRPKYHQVGAMSKIVPSRRPHTRSEQDPAVWNLLVTSAPFRPCSSPSILCRKVGGESIIYFSKNWKINFRDAFGQANSDILSGIYCMQMTQQTKAVSSGCQRMVLLAPGRLVPDPSQRQLSHNKLLRRS